MTISSIFLLSPAHCGGKRAATLLRPEANFDLAVRLRSPAGAPIGEVFSYVSGLYFRGKVAYASAFGRPLPGIPESLVITSGRGLMPVGATVDLADVLAFAEIPIDLGDPRYREPLIADVERLRHLLPEDCQVVLLGSIATSKYIELLLSILGPRLCFPAPFLGTGDMARGAIMLRAAREGVELPYVSALGAVRSLARSRSGAG